MVLHSISIESKFYSYYTHVCMCVCMRVYFTADIYSIIDYLTIFRFMTTTVTLTNSDIPQLITTIRCSAVIFTPVTTQLHNILIFSLTASVETLDLILPSLTPASMEGLKTLMPRRD